MKRINNPISIRLNIGLLILAVNFFLCSSVLAGINQWTRSGPEGATINALVISPNYASDNTVFVGTEYGGIYKSTNGGVSWNQVNGELTNTYYVSSLVISPSYASDNTV